METTVLPAKPVVKKSNNTIIIWNYCLRNESLDVYECIHPHIWPSTSEVSTSTNLRITMLPTAFDECFERICLRRFSTLENVRREGPSSCGTNLPQDTINVYKKRPKAGGSLHPPLALRQHAPAARCSATTTRRQTPVRQPPMPCQEKEVTPPTTQTIQANTRPHIKHDRTQKTAIIQPSIVITRPTTPPSSRDSRPPKTVSISTPAIRRQRATNTVLLLSQPRALPYPREVRPTSFLRPDPEEERCGHQSTRLTKRRRNHRRPSSLLSTLAMGEDLAAHQEAYVQVLHRSLLHRLAEDHNRSSAEEHHVVARIPGCSCNDPEGKVPFYKVAREDN